MAPSFFAGVRLSPRPRKEPHLASRTVSTVLVVLVHIFFFFFFAVSILKFDERGHRMVETILMLPVQGNDREARRRLVAPEFKQDDNPAASTAPIAIPRLPPPIVERDDHTAAPGDILGAVGQTLACAAGNFEHLTQPERERCRRIPWQGAKIPNGSIVMLPKDAVPRLAEPAPEFRMSGAEQLNRDLATGGPPCPILQNTPCLSGILHGNSRAGALGSHN
jgi:hypothetical protein